MKTEIRMGTGGFPITIKLKMQMEIDVDVNKAVEMHFKKLNQN